MGGDVAVRGEKGVLQCRVGWGYAVRGEKRELQCRVGWGYCSAGWDGDIAVQGGMGYCEQRGIGILQCKRRGGFAGYGRGGLGIAVWGRGVLQCMKRRGRYCSLKFKPVKNVFHILTQVTGVEAGNIY